jgi:hypothetical protein
MRADNNIGRVIARAQANDAILYWQCVNQQENRLTFVDHEDITAFEREGTWLITPVLDLSVVDINGVLR